MAIILLAFGVGLLIGIAIADLIKMLMRDGTFVIDGERVEINFRIPLDVLEKREELYLTVEKR